MDTLIATALILSSLIYLAYNYFTWNFNYFKSRGIPGPKPVPVFGNYWRKWINTDMNEVAIQEREKYGPIYGTFRGRTPCLNISDPKIMREILIKMSNAFMDRPNLKLNYKINTNVAFQKGEHWKTIRHSMTPAFSASKLNGLIDDMDSLSRKFVKFLEIESQQQQNGGIISDVRSECVGYFLDLIAKCTFGIDFNSIGKPNHIARRFVREGFGAICNESMLSTLCLFYPRFAQTVIPASVFKSFDYFLELTNIFTNLQKEGQPWNPKTFLDVIFKEVYDKKKGGKPMTDNLTFLSQVAGIVFGGFEMNASFATCLLYQLASNPDVQHKLREEIRTAIDKQCDNCDSEEFKVTRPDFLYELPYLEQCIYEGLRMYPPNSKLERVALENNLQVPGLEFKLKKGTIIHMPIHAICTDPANFPNPQKFDPDRWSPEAKAARDPLLNLAFGHGPRQCIGMRLSMQQLKICFTHLINNFEFSHVNENEIKPLKTHVGLVGLIRMDSPVALKINKVLSPAA